MKSARRIGTEVLKEIAQMVGASHQELERSLGSKKLILQDSK